MLRQTKCCLLAKTSSWRNNEAIPYYCSISVVQVTLLFKKASVVMISCNKIALVFLYLVTDRLISSFACLFVINMRFWLVLGKLTGEGRCVRCRMMD